MEIFRAFGLILLLASAIVGQDVNNDEPVYPRDTREIQPRQATSAPTCTCGQSTLNENRIVNGQTSSPNEFPWSVALYMRAFLSKYSFFCGGSIINERWILTAAHCVQGYQALSLPWNPMIVVAGAQDLTKEENSTRQYRPVYFTQMRTHPQYSTLTHNFDIALLELSTPLNITKAVSPGCLPYNYLNNTFAGEKVTADGWGVTGEKKEDSAKENLKVILDVISNEKCQELYNTNSTSRVQIKDEMMCTYTYNNQTGGSDTCQGDSGGAIQWRNPLTNLYYLTGIVSFGEGCGRENRPGAYARVTKLMDFIEKTTKTKFCNPQ